MIFLLQKEIPYTENEDRTAETVLFFLCIKNCLSTGVEQFFCLVLTFLSESEIDEGIEVGSHHVAHAEEEQQKKQHIRQGHKDLIA